VKSDPASISLNRSDNSLRWGKVALGVSIMLFGISIFIPDWERFWVIGLAVSGILWLDHLMYL
jgi:hypothetical protein